MRLCPQCGSQLGWHKQVNAIYCSAICKAAAFRSDHMAQAKRALELLREAPAPVGIRSITAAATVDDPRGNTWSQRLAFLRRNEPTVVDTFGMAVLTAAARPVPQGTCRWCLAYAHSHVKQLPEAKFNSATRLLLGGTPCTSCLERMRADVKARVDAGRKTPRRTSTSGAGGSRSRSSSGGARTAATSGGGVGTYHRGAPCLVCRTYLDVSAQGGRGRNPVQPPPHERIPV